PVCGNGVVERAAGETCDPPSACTTQMTACVSDANYVRTSSGSVSACTYVCTTRPRACGPADTFCPTGCGPTMDVDCPGCGNGRVETGETCDPPSACMTQMTACVSDANNVRTSSGSVSACTYVCTTRPRACGPADTFCPTGCGPTMDVDCPGCGNGRVETGETCDPPSACMTQMTACVSDANNVRTSSGSVSACTYVCTTRPRACGPADTFCPTGCGPTMDVDCPGCGNGRVETGETCDPPSACMTQMTACVSDANNVRTSSGSVSACTYVCTTRPRTCGPSDTFCPTGCGPTMDVDCPGCGNGRIETGESCD